MIDVGAVLALALNHAARVVRASATLGTVEVGAATPWDIAAELERQAADYRARRA